MARSTVDADVPVQVHLDLVVKVLFEAIAKLPLLVIVLEAPERKHHSAGENIEARPMTVRSEQ